MMFRPIFLMPGTASSSSSHSFATDPAETEALQTLEDGTRKLEEGLHRKRVPLMPKTLTFGSVLLLLPKVMQKQHWHSTNGV